MRPTLWLAHGLVVRSDDVPLEARSAPPGAEPDVTIRLRPPGRVPAYGEPLPGRRLAFYDDGTAALSACERLPGTATAGEQVVDICFHGVCLARYDRRAAVVDLTLDELADPRLASVLVSGTLLSVVLMLRGHPVLHASAVAVEEDGVREAIAFVGDSGMGKSTLAALLCRDGAEFMTDDLLRTDLMPDGSVVAWPGATAARLRPGARALAAEMQGTVTVTADGRYATAPRKVSSPEAVRLRALVIPRPDPEASALELQRLGGPGALLMLARFPRIPGWSDPATSGAAHLHGGELVRRVPLFIATTPWGPPFAPGLGAELVEAVRAHQP